MNKIKIKLMPIEMKLWLFCHGLFINVLYMERWIDENDGNCNDTDNDNDNDNSIKFSEAKHWN